MKTSNLTETDLSVENIKEAFTAHLVIPDVINIAPQEKLIVTYKDNTSLELGNLISAEHTVSLPKINMEKFDKNTYYTVILTDPDVPNRATPTKKEYLHWMVINITNKDITEGNEIVFYEAPFPKKGSGLHRFVFLLLEQSNFIVIDNSDNNKSQNVEKLVQPLPDLNEKKNQNVANNVQKQKSPTNNKNVKVVDQAQPKTIQKKPDQSTLQEKESKTNLFSTNNTNNSNFDRLGFSTKNFISKYMIRSVKAANFFQTEYNELVETKEGLGEKVSVKEGTTSTKKK